ncbi:MAG TPA: chemotaxis protein, partial [Patescibacteria group bacterium]|nr:chemotaxis protein [Patescibacteria group bacterium]
MSTPSLRGQTFQATLLVSLAVGTIILVALTAILRLMQNDAGFGYAALALLSIAAAGLLAVSILARHRVDAVLTLIEQGAAVTAQAAQGDL